eukprot:TRINITY_DN34653_c0_g1_i1.p1 TRINITY_DN34653_c0_g1~~TRINITY_DN34653_c0_g1_i1.p1  ORF type:complete len:411 (+),score=57.15 TRINITY_DN34653_c0_g1_i1:31-1233(+)
MTESLAASELPVWDPSFDHQEVWIFNTAYWLFGDEGPLVSPARTYWSRFDEISKCCASPPFGATVRIFFADGVISIAGLGLSKWMQYIGQRAPSEQTIARLLYPNIEAAWRGERKTLGFEEAREDLDRHGIGCYDTWIPSMGGQPTPGVFVWRNRHGQFSKDGNVVSTEDPDQTTWNAAYFLQNLKDERSSCLGGGAALAESSASLVVGTLLDFGGTELCFWAQKPLTDVEVDAGVAHRCAPKICVTVLGGPKGISSEYQDAVRRAFQQKGVSLLEISLGAMEQMAHTCVGYLRVQDDCGRYRAAVTDLLRLGPQEYCRRVRAVEKDLLVRYRHARAADSRDRSSSIDARASNGCSGRRFSKGLRKPAILKKLVKPRLRARPVPSLVTATAASRREKRAT